LSNLINAILDATLLFFGAVHNVFMRFTCGRLNKDIRYFNTTLHNNYLWPCFAGAPLSDKQRNAIGHAAQCVLGARGQFSNSPLADRYKPLSIPAALRKAHQKIDAAVDTTYQPSDRKKVLRLLRRTRSLPLWPVPTHHQFAPCASCQENTQNQSQRKLLNGTRFKQC
jgi:hypothetical protein